MDNTLILGPQDAASSKSVSKDLHPPQNVDGNKSGTGQVERQDTRISLCDDWNLRGFATICAFRHCG